MSGLVSGVGLMWLTADALGGVAYDRGGWSAVVVKAGVGIVVYAVFSLVLLRTPDGRRLWRYSFERVRLKIRRS
jgi:membrane protein YdbS with pleckstrin-like domain